jgi:hypothetical protein
MGQYQYTFATKAPATIDRNATHTIGVYSNRNLTEFDLGTQFSDDVFSFTPSGVPVTVTRDCGSKTAACNQCHNPLASMAAHGRRSSCACCVTRPRPPIPYTGNTVEFAGA